LGNSRTQKASLKEELVELRTQLETERADCDRCRTSWLEGKNCIGSGKNEKLGAIAIGVEFWSQLKTERADRKKIEAELYELKQNSAPAATVSEKLTPDAATILSQLGAKCKKSQTDLVELEAILEILESWGDKS
jgi:hypothetical protein